MQALSPLSQLAHPLFEQHQLTVFIKRDDQIHNIISGNKWRKLKYNLQQAQKASKGVLTFGGSYSNHIHACAFACYQQGIPSIAIIRGEIENQNNYTLAWAKYWNMQLCFVDRKTYRLRENQHYLEQLQRQYPEYLIVPEGGSNELALQGVSEVIDELNQQCQFDTLMTPVGSGGTIAGLVQGDNNQHQILGIAVLKQTDYLNQQVTKLLKIEKNYHNWQIMNQFHRGGYAKFSQVDAERIKAFSDATQVDFEPIYSGKMILALLDLIEAEYFPKHHRIVLLHTGGIQGLAGMFERNKLNPKQWPKLPVPPLS